MTAKKQRLTTKTALRTFRVKPAEDGAFDVFKSEYVEGEGIWDAFEQTFATEQAAECYVRMRIEETKQEATGNGATNLLKLLNEATADDLAEIEIKIMTAEKELDALRTLRKVIDVKVNGPTQRKPRGTNGAGQRGPTAGAGTTEERVKQVAKYLLSSGTAKITTLAQLVGADGRGFHHVIKHPWFVQSGEFAKLSDEGKAAASKL